MAASRARRLAPTVKETHVTCSPGHHSCVRIRATGRRPRRRSTRTRRRAPLGNKDKPGVGPSWWHTLHRRAASATGRARCDGRAALPTSLAEAPSATPTRHAAGLCQGRRRGHHRATTDWMAAAQRPWRAGLALSSEVRGGGGMDGRGINHRRASRPPLTPSQTDVGGRCETRGRDVPAQHHRRSSLHGQPQQNAILFRRAERAGNKRDSVEFFVYFKDFSIKSLSHSMRAHRTTSSPSSNTVTRQKRVS